MKKKIISIILCAAMLASATSAFAREIVHVSDWAYNDVSVFTSEDLITEGLADVSDYRQNITRGQFIELMCSVLIKTTQINKNYVHPAWYNYFEDIGDNYYYQLAIGTHLVNGETLESETNEYGVTTVTRARLRPDEPITRQDAAVLALTTLSRINFLRLQNYPIYSETEFDADGVALEIQYQSKLTYDDADSVADYAARAVYALSDLGLMQGMGKNKFEPLGNITVEQAISLLYRIYRTYPHTDDPDGTGITADTEKTIKTYENGYTETKLGETLYLKKDGVSIPFDTDIYSNIYCSTASDGNVYAAAQTYSDTTDIFNAVTGELLVTLPVYTYMTDANYIYVKAAKSGKTAFGLYDYSGKEVIPAKYSLSEIDYMIKNGLKEPEYSYRAPDGWIYYADWSDGGHMYRVDSNGENKQKISDEDCYDISYYNGRLYYYIRGKDEGCLFTMLPDGSDVTKLSDGKCYGISSANFLTYEDGSPLSADDTQNKPYMFFLDSVGNDDSPSMFTYRFLYRLTYENGKAHKELVTDDCGSYNMVAAKDKSEKSWLYFTSAKMMTDDSSESYLYRTDGDVVECVNDKVKIKYFVPITTTDGRTLFHIEGPYNEETKSRGYDYIADLDLNYIEEYDDEKWEYTVDGIRVKQVWTSNGDGSQSGRYVPIDPSDNEEFYKGEISGATKDDSLSDDKYSVYYDNKNGGMFYTSDPENGERHQLLHGTNFSDVQRFGNKLYCFDSHDGDSVSSDGTIYSIDMDTGETKAICDGVYTTSYASDSAILYIDTGLNYRRLDINTDTVSEVYPNSNKNRYGKPIDLRAYDSKNLTKLDEDGNMSDILTDDVNVNYMIYVPNGSNTNVDIDRYGYYEPVIYGYDRVYRVG